ncbi:MAG: motility associated factor glycosyltransferase family protein [Treponema sp.]|nr:motility associated factor glycosyltransferase family protein [Treponema sp.]
MNSIWNKNLQAFKRRFPSLFEIYSSQITEFEKKHADNITENPFLTITQAKNGEMTASFNGILLHSAYNPSREAEAVVSETKDVKNIIFPGFGLGYQVNAVSREIRNDQRLILIEEDINFFLTALSVLDWQNVFKVSNLIIAVSCPLDQLISLIEEQNEIGLNDNGVSNSFIVSHNAFMLHSKKYFDQVLEIINRNKKKNELNTSTMNRFLKLWIRNSTKNLNQILKRQTVNDFIKMNPKAENCIVVAAGPSLQSLLEPLKILQKTNTIICVETALHALLRNDINPDFIIITDPQYYAYRHLSFLKAPQSILIAPISVHQAVFRFMAKDILLCSDKIPISSYFEQTLGEFGNLGAGGSVASCAWTLAKQLGAKNIYLAGLDLAYISKETHIKGSNAEKQWNTENSRSKTIEQFSFSSMINSNPEVALNYKNEKVLTDSKMKMFAWWFESQIQKNPDIKTYTLSEKSLKIPCVSTKDVEELCKEQKGSKCTFITGKPYVNEEQFKKTEEAFRKDILPSLLKRTEK